MSTWSTRAAVRECQLTSHGDLTVTERLATLLDTGQFADVTIRVGQGTDLKSFKAHRLLLASASQPLYRLVSTVQHGHADLNTFRVTDMDPAAFKSVLKFIYTDIISIDSIAEAFALLKAGKRWNLKKMNVRTIKYLEDFLDDYNPTSEEKKNEIFDLLLLADAHSQELFEKCLTVVINHAKDIIPSQGFLRLDERTIRRLIGDSRFVYENQLGLFEAIRDWGMNQILLKCLNPTQLHPTIEDLLTHVDFEKIKDNDFMGTILPSDCLGRAEVIAFFMTRGMEIPRDMGFNNNKQDTSIVQNGEVRDFKKACRFKRGYRLPHKEIYQEHEIRFRVDKNIKLLGVGFGFLFSNTDMGVTVHCQGPWERVQWTDMTQTYCRVSWEKMNTADLRLMFSEPARLEANHSYKVLVRVTRMTSGSTDVELWGGKEGLPFVEAEDAKFYFIKAAVDPNKEVDPREMDTKQGMITELLYVIDDSPPPKIEEITVRRRRSQLPIEEASKPTEEVVTKSFIRKRPLKTDDEPVETSSLARRRDAGGAYHRWQHPAMSTVSDTSTSKWATKEKTPEPPKESRRTPESNEVSSYYVRKRPSPVRERKVAETPAFLKPKTSSTTATSPDSPFGERLSRPSARTPWSSRSTATTNDSTASTGTSRFGRDTTTRSSLYSTGSSRYGRESSINKDTSITTPSRSTLGDTGTSGSSLYSSRRDSATSSTVPSYRRDSATTLSTARKDSVTDSISSTPASSLYRSNSSVASRYARDLSASRYGSRFGRDSSASRYGTSYGSSYSSGSTPSYGSSRFLGSSYTSRYR